MYIVSPLLAGFVETVIARKKYGKSTGAISALLTFFLINGYGWFGPGWIFPKEPVTLSLITIIAIMLTIQAAFPIFVNYLLTVVVLGTFIRFIEFLVNMPSKIMRKPPETKTEITIQADETFLDELSIPLVSVPNVNGGKIKKYVGLVIGEAIAEEKESKERFSKLQKFIQPTTLEDMNLGEARKMAISQMLEKAESMGANAVVEVLLDYVSMGGLQGSATIVTATGTAVIFQEKNSYSDESVEVSEVTEKVSSVGESTPEMDEKIDVSEVHEKVSVLGESIPGLGEKTKGKLSDKDSTDDASNRIDQFLNEKSDLIIKNWEFFTQLRLGGLEMSYSNISRDVGELDKTIEEHWKYANKKINKKRIDKKK